MLADVPAKVAQIKCGFFHAAGLRLCACGAMPQGARRLILRRLLEHTRLLYTYIYIYI